MDSTSAVQSAAITRMLRRPMSKVVPRGTQMRLSGTSGVAAPFVLWMAVPLVDRASSTSTPPRAGLIRTCTRDNDWVESATATARSEELPAVGERPMTSTESTGSRCPESSTTYAAVTCGSSTTARGRA